MFPYLFAIKTKWSSTATFDPADISGLIYRVDPTYSYTDLGATTLATDTSLVRTVVPRIGSPNLARDTGDTNRPTFSATGLNGKPYLIFDGIANKLRAVFTLAQPYTRITVWRHRDTQDNNHVMMDGGTADQAYLNFASANAVSMYASTGRVSTTASNNVWYSSVEVFNGASSSLRLNKGTATIGNPGTGTPDGVSFGSAGNFGLTYPTKADLAYLLIYNRSLNTSEQDLLFDWLRTRFAHY